MHKPWQQEEEASAGGPNVRECVDCGIKSPQTDTNYTLISSRHGWRLSRSFDATGEKIMQWRCPDCWARHKNLRK